MEKEFNKQVRWLFHQQGFRLTKPRRIILDVLRKSPCHLSVNEMHRKIKEIGTIGLATVYRSLKLLAEVGLIGEVRYAHKKVFYHRSLNSHQHIICLKCNKIKNVLLWLDELINSAKQISNYRILSCEILIKGICPKCQTQKRKRGVTNERIS